MIEERGYKLKDTNLVRKMSKLLQQREAMVYAPETVSTDSSWAYIHSYTIRPSSIGDLDAKNYKFGGSPQVA